MNILYISSISPCPDMGPYWSIPNQVKSQGLFDNVFWFNRLPDHCDNWASTGVFHSLLDYPNERLSDFPAPFNYPDLVIFESFYDSVYKLYYQVKQLNIPYIIIPRGALTHTAQYKKHWKKIWGNVLFFRRFANNAKAIQYLTNEEYFQSGDKWNKNSFVIPNGVVTVSDKQWKAKQKVSSLKGTYVGRISIYHKGLDLLVKACKLQHNLLIENGVTIDIYGPNRENQRDNLKKLIDDFGVSDILILHDKSLVGEEKDIVLSKSDFFVLTSRFEGHPMGLIEALSYGLPSLVTRGCNMMDEILASNAGWVAENNFESISEAIGKLIQEKHEITIKSANAIKLAKSYRWESIAEESHNIYLKTISNE